MAEGEGFEPSIRFPVYTLSRRAPSTTRPPLPHGDPAVPSDVLRRLWRGRRASPSRNTREAVVYPQFGGARKSVTQVGHADRSPNASVSPVGAGRTAPGLPSEWPFPSRPETAWPEAGRRFASGSGFLLRGSIDIEPQGRAFSRCIRHQVPGSSSGFRPAYGRGLLQPPRCRSHAAPPAAVPPAATPPAPGSGPRALSRAGRRAT